jgi:hypothetical protein
MHVGIPMSLARSGAALLMSILAIAAMLVPADAWANQSSGPSTAQDARRRDLLRSSQVPAGSVPLASPATTTAATTAVAVPRSKFGFAVADVSVGSSSAPEKSTLKKAADAGAGWMLGWVSWSSLRPTASGSYVWLNADGTRRCQNTDIDNVVRGARAYGLNPLIRLQGVPGWATSDSSDHLVRLQANALQTFAQDLANYVRACYPTQTVAYQVFNEPNLNYEWGANVTSASASAYARLLHAAYLGFHARGSATVVSAGLADGATSPSMSDLNYLQALYRAGARGGTHFDALGTHPYGGNSAPSTDPNAAACSATCFRRAELQHNIMVRNGDSTPMWATEVGWLMDPKSLGGPDYDLGPSFNWMKVSAQAQADYTVGALQYAQMNWPWMARMFVFNLDHSTAMWCGSAQTGYIGQCYPPRTSVYWFSTLEGSTDMWSPSYRSPRPVYNALAAMPKS